MSALDVGMLSTNDFGHYSACIRCEVGTCAALSFGLRVVTIVPSVVGPFLDCPRHEGPPFVKLKGCCDVSKVTEVELCMSTPHELIYCSPDSSEDTAVAPGELCHAASVCESIKIREITYGVFAGESSVRAKEDENCCKGETASTAEGYKV